MSRPTPLSATERSTLYGDLQKGLRILLDGRPWNGFRSTPQPFIYSLCRLLVESGSEWVCGIDAKKAIEDVLTTGNKFNPEGHFAQIWGSSLTNQRAWPVVTRWRRVLDRTPSKPYYYRFLDSSGARQVRGWLTTISKSLGQHALQKLLAEQSLDELLAAALRSASDTLPTLLRTSSYQYRSALIKAYAKRRANGSCEACGAHAPFVTIDGEAFLEVHHIRDLRKDSGPDSPKNVAAICPNCHRRAHFGMDRQEFNSMISAKIAMRQDDIERKSRQGLPRPRTGRLGT
ncbi:MAG: HNH endonuclease signature motif containing protein [Acidobacteriota bacterium]